MFIKDIDAYTHIYIYKYTHVSFIAFRFDFQYNIGLEFFIIAFVVKQLLILNDLCSFLQIYIQNKRLNFHFKCN